MTRHQTEGSTGTTWLKQDRIWAIGFFHLRHLKAGVADPLSARFPRFPTRGISAISPMFCCADLFRKFAHYTLCPLSFGMSVV